MTCQDLDLLEAAYVAGTLDAPTAQALEHHAARCARCAARIDALSRRDLSSFAPPLPPELRARTMAAVKARRRAPMRRAWPVGAIAAAAAAVVFALGDAPRRDSPRLPSARAESASAPAAVDGSRASFTPGLVLAEERSRTEFAALDRADAELRAALAAAPDDRELQSFLAAVAARRAELERRVKDAAS